MRGALNQNLAEDGEPLKNMSPNRLRKNAVFAKRSVEFLNETRA
jgi:hypothetical protein